MLVGRTGLARLAMTGDQALDAFLTVAVRLVARGAVGVGGALGAPAQHASRLLATGAVPLPAALDAGAGGQVAVLPVGRAVGFAGARFAALACGVAGFAGFAVACHQAVHAAREGGAAIFGVARALTGRGATGSARAAGAASPGSGRAPGGARVAPGPRQESKLLVAAAGREQQRKRDPAKHPRKIADPNGTGPCLLAPRCGY